MSMNDYRNTGQTPAWQICFKFSNQQVLDISSLAPPTFLFIICWENLEVASWQSENGKWLLQKEGNWRGKRGEIWNEVKSPLPLAELTSNFHKSLPSRILFCPALISHANQHELYNHTIGKSPYKIHYFYFPRLIFWWILQINDCSLLNYTTLMKNLNDITILVNIMNFRAILTQIQFQYGRLTVQNFPANFSVRI